MLNILHSFQKTPKVFKEVDFRLHPLEADEGYLIRKHPFKLTAIAPSRKGFFFLAALLFHGASISPVSICFKVVPGVCRYSEESGRIYRCNLAVSMFALHDLYLHS